MSDTVYRIPESVVEDTLAFRQNVEKFVSGETSEMAFRAIRVPMGIYEQRENGSYMVRVRGAAGVFLPHQLRHMAELSDEFGNGTLHVTTRQDIQIHYVDIADTPTVLEKLLEVGLSSRGGGGNTVRNVSACPLAGVCVDEVFDVTPYAIALTEYLIENKANFNLPRKFKVAFSGCGKDCALASVADLGFFAHIKDGTRGFSVYAGGGMGMHSSLAVIIEEFIPAQSIIEVAEAVKRLFDKYGDRTNRHKARLRFVVERFGHDDFRKLYREELEQVRNEQTMVLSSLPELHSGCLKRSSETRSRFRELCSSIAKMAESALVVAQDSIISQPTGPRADEPGYHKWRSKNVLSQKQEALYTVRVSLPLGDIKALSLCALAGLAEKVGDGIVRTTQEQDLQLRNIPETELPGVYNALKEIQVEFVQTPSVRTVACAGASTCKLGLCLSRGLAEAIDQELKDVDVPFDVPLRISGCPNSCGQHPIAPLGLFGSAVRSNGRLLPLYTITIGGRMAEGDARLGQFVTRVPARAVPGFLKDFWTAAAENVNPGESFEDLIERWGSGYLKELSVKYAKIPSYEESPEYYRDFGADEDFSLAGRGPGECGAGVMDVISLEIDSAKKAFDEKNLYDAVMAASRALLVTRGLEPKKDREVVQAFREHFIDKGLVNRTVEGALDAALDFKLGDRDTLDDLSDEIGSLIDRVVLLFESLDSSLSFRIDTIEQEETQNDTSDGSDQVQELDLRGVACPMNFVRAKLQLEQVETGDVLEILLDDGAPVQNVPASFTDQGEEVVSVTSEGSHYRVKVRRLSTD